MSNANGTGGVPKPWSLLSTGWTSVGMVKMAHEHRPWDAGTARGTGGIAEQRQYEVFA